MNGSPEHITDDQAEAYLLGHLADRETAALEEHLLVCEECRQRFSKTERYVRILRAALNRLERGGGPEQQEQ